jgi:hypothetical protein
LRRIHFEYAFGTRPGCCVVIRSIKDPQQRIDVEVSQRAFALQRCERMANVEVAFAFPFHVVHEPDVGFHTGTSEVQRFVEWYLAPVVVVAVTLQRFDVASDCCWISCRCIRIWMGAWDFPVRK